MVISTGQSGLAQEYYSKKKKGEIEDTLMQSYLWMIPNMLSSCLLYACIRFICTSNIASKLTCNIGYIAWSGNNRHAGCLAKKEVKWICSETFTLVSVSMYSASLILLTLFICKSEVQRYWRLQNNKQLLFSDWGCREKYHTFFHSVCKSGSFAYSLKPAMRSIFRIHASVPSHFEMIEHKLGLLTTIQRRWHITN